MSSACRGRIEAARNALISSPACAPGLTKRLAATIAALRDSDIPAEASATVRRGLVDCVGVMIAGSGEPSSGES